LSFNQEVGLLTMPVKRGGEEERVVSLKEKKIVEGERGKWEWG